MMYFRTIIAGTISLTASFSVLLADEKVPSATECPFSYELPDDIKPVVNLYAKTRQAGRLQSVVWSADCHPVSSSATLPPTRGTSWIQRTFLTCVIEPTPPHRRICPTTSRWNDLDKIWILTTQTDPPSTIVEYVASSSDDYFLSIKAEVKSKEYDALMKQTLSEIVKVAASVQLTSKSPLTSERHSPAITVKDTPVPAMVAIKPISGCPFEFELPGEVTPNMDGDVEWTSGKGQLKSGRWVMVCGSDPVTNAHLRRTLDRLSCRVETTPPHHQICARSKRWNGTDRVTILTVDGRSTVEFNAYTADDQLLLFAITLEKHADQSLIEHAVGVAQAVSRSVKLPK